MYYVDLLFLAKNEKQFNEMNHFQEKEKID